MLVTLSLQIEAANTSVTAHNATVQNIEQEIKTLTSQVWKYLLEVELKADITLYMSKKAGIGKAISSFQEQIQNAEKIQFQLQSEIRQLEKDTTSIQPTVDSINTLLSSFGFKSFSIAKAEKGNCYKLVRPDGSDAKETLSEGEKTFVTFLYFYNLLKGSASESGITTDRIVVFDDPVSSLDSDILFIVSTLMKNIFEDIRQGRGLIKQAFILTHNVYFHKEITFNPNRRGNAMSDETFWVVRKSGLSSTVEKHSSNPIKTSYELLWAEVRRSDRSNLAIQNTLRRILENYFKILGNIDSDAICALFEGHEKIICKSLFSWVNDGSHFANDDVFVSIDDNLITNYLSVFRGIFEKSKHLAHYKMMMGDAYTEPEIIPIPKAA